MSREWTKNPLYNTATAIHNGKAVTLHYWTDDEKQRLAQLYFSGVSIPRLATMFGVSVAAARGKLWSMRCLPYRGTKPWWTREDVAYLEQHYGQRPTSEIAEKLGRNRAAVVHKAGQLGIRFRSRDWFTLSEVAEILGVTNHWVRRRLNNGFKFDVKCFDGTPSKSNYFPWQISRKSLRDFIRTYPSELVGKRIDIVTIVDILAGVKREATK